MSSLLEHLKQQTQGVIDPEVKFECPEVSNEDLEIITAVLGQSANGKPTAMLNANEWWEVYQVVRRVRNAVIRNRIPNSLPFSQLSWLEQAFLLQGPLLGDRSTAGTALEAVEDAARGNNDDDIILAINITMVGGGQVTTEDPFPLFTNWQWTGSPIDRSWMLSEASLFEATRNGGFNPEQVTFDWSNPIQVETWQLAIPGIFAHVTELLQSFFEAYKKDKAVHNGEDDIVSTFLNPSLRFLIGLISHYRNLGVIQNPEMTMEEKVHLGQILTLPGDGADPCRNAPELSAGHEAIYQFFKKNVDFWDFTKFKMKEA